MTLQAGKRVGGWDGQSEGIYTHRGNGEGTCTPNQTHSRAILSVISPPLTYNSIVICPLYKHTVVQLFSSHVLHMPEISLLHIPGVIDAWDSM